MESSETLEQIDKKYLIKEKIGCGGEANIFLVLKKGTNEEYAAKVPKREKNTLDIEISSLNHLKQYKNPNILNIIEDGEGEIIRKNRKTRTRKYCILENAVYGNIFDFIYYAKPSGFGERKSKVIFSKIVEGVKFCHEHNICHRDLKLDNILLDKNFCIKISDFGHSCINAENLEELRGTRGYAPPEVGRQPYDGFKVDAFCLGPILMILVIGYPGFRIPSMRDPNYGKIIDKEFDLFWNLIDPIAQSREVTLSTEFKDLYIKMVQYFPNERIEVKNILSHPWFKEINDMNQEQKDQLVNEINDEFYALSPIVKENNQEYVEIETKKSVYASYNTKSDNDNKFQFFDDNCKPKCEDTPINMKNCINIKGDLKPNQFMNKLCNILYAIFGEDNCSIEADKEKLKLKFNISFYHKQEKEAKEKEDEEKEEESENEEEEEKITDLKIQIKLYKISDGHLLRFTQREGERKDFLDKYGEISKIVRNILC